MTCRRRPSWRLPTPPTRRLSSTAWPRNPTPNGWDALAYLHWYAAVGRPAEAYVALGRLWERRFGAELVAHWGTMLQCYVDRPPRSLGDAWDLARMHDLVAPSTLALPGIRLRHYAPSLVGCDRWFLHERP